jgi:uncharacterized protein with HEPN domain
MKSQLSDKARLNHILDAINAVEQYTKEVSFEEFTKSSEKTFATVKQLEIIGEAANRITEDTRNLDRDIEWSKIIGLRNILVHDYYIVDHSVIWEIVEDELSKLRLQIVALISKF